MSLVLPESRLRAWFTLLRAPGVGPARLRVLLDHAGDIERALALSAAEWRRLGIPPAAIAWRDGPDQARLTT